MAKVKDAGNKSKTNVTARAAAKLKAKICRFCGKEVISVRVLSPNGRVSMERRCCNPL